MKKRVLLHRQHWKAEEMIVLPILLLTLVYGSRPAVLAARESSDIGRQSLEHIDRLMITAIEDGETAGGVVLVGHENEVVYRKAFGHRSIEPQMVEMTVNTVFDLASLTKVVATATSVALLVERGDLSLHDPISTFIPECASYGKKNVTIEDLLIHRAGLIPDNPLGDYANGPDEAMRRIYDLKLLAEPGREFIYTDVGYILLGEIVQRVSGMPLDEFAAREIFDPAGMSSTMFKLSNELRQRCASQEKREGRWIVGEVHDPRAFALGGVAGHAGLFSTADDLSRYCRMILNGGRIDERRVLSAATIRAMTTPRPEHLNRDLRGLGFDVATGYSSPRGDLFSRCGSFGHSGFTGTSFWIDPASRSYVIILTNRLHPDGKGNVIPLRRRIANVVAAAFPVEPFGHLAWVGNAQCERYGNEPDGSKTHNTTVLTGLDVLVREEFKSLLGRNVGLITNHTGMARDGESNVNLFTRVPGMELVALFAPEHGFRGILDRKVEDETHLLTNLPIYSLYGATRTPTEEMLKGIDTLVFDIQDIGARFYTYIATMGNAMRAAAKQQVRFVVLDRPNPITGQYVAGPIADRDKLGFTAFHRLPVAHGMTIGELATMFNKEMAIGVDLAVIKMANWHRDQWYDETGLLWVNPSPNMRNLTQAILYPGIGLVEGANVSVGRGTDEPFERLGAPWIDARRLAKAMNEADLEGVRFVPIEFTPTASKFAGEKCGGLHILVTDREKIDSTKVGITLVWYLRDLFGSNFEFEKVNRLLVNDQVLEAIKNADAPYPIDRIWRKDLDRFVRIRSQYLIYP